MRRVDFELLKCSTPMATHRTDTGCTAMDSEVWRFLRAAAMGRVVGGQYHYVRPDRRPVFCPANFSWKDLSAC